MLTPVRFSVTPVRRTAQRVEREVRTVEFCQHLRKFAFLGGNLILFVSRAPDAATVDAVGLRELPDNPVLTTDLTTRIYRRAQSNRLADFEPAHRCSPSEKLQ